MLVTHLKLEHKRRDKCTEELKKFHAVTEITLSLSLTIFELLSAIIATVTHGTT